MSQLCVNSPAPIKDLGAPILVLELNSIKDRIITQTTWSHLQCKLPAPRLKCLIRFSGAQAEQMSHEGLLNQREPDYHLDLNEEMMEMAF